MLGSVPQLSQLQPTHVKTHSVTVEHFMLVNGHFQNKTQFRCSCLSVCPAIPAPAAAGDEEQKCQAGDWTGLHPTSSREQFSHSSWERWGFMILFCNHPWMQTAGMEMFPAETLPASPYLVFLPLRAIRKQNNCSHLVFFSTSD